MDSWYLWAFFSAVFAALTAMLAKIGVEGINSNFATFVRTLVVAVFLFVLLAATGAFHPVSSISRRSMLFLVLSGIATGLSWLCYFRAIQLGPISRVAPIDKLSLLMIALMGVWFLGEKLSLHHWAGIVLMAAGVVLLAVR